MVEPLWLIKSGCSEETAFGLEPVERLAWVIVMGQFEGGEWDYDNMCWREKKGS